VQDSQGQYLLASSRQLHAVLPKRCKVTSSQLSEDRYGPKDTIRLPTLADSISLLTDQYDPGPYDMSPLSFECLLLHRGLTASGQFECLRRAQNRHCW
jgi:hypothetical protein